MQNLTRLIRGVQLPPAIAGRLPLRHAPTRTQLADAGMNFRAGARHQQYFRRQRRRPRFFESRSYRSHVAGARDARQAAQWLAQYTAILHKARRPCRQRGTANTISRWRPSRLDGARVSRLARHRPQRACAPFLRQSCRWAVVTNDSSCWSQNRRAVPVLNQP